MCLASLSLALVLGSRFPSVGKARVHRRTIVSNSSDHDDHDDHDDNDDNDDHTQTARTTATRVHDRLRSPVQHGRTGEKLRQYPAMLTARPASDCREDRAGIRLSGIARQAGSPHQQPHSTAGLSSLPLLPPPQTSTRFSSGPCDPFLPTTRPRGLPLASPRELQPTSSIPTSAWSSSEREQERGRGARTRCAYDRDGRNGNATHARCIGRGTRSRPNASLLAILILMYYALALAASRLRASRIPTSDSYVRDERNSLLRDRLQASRDTYARTRLSDRFERVREFDRSIDRRHGNHRQDRRTRSRVSCFSFYAR